MPQQQNKKTPLEILRSKLRDWPTPMEPVDTEEELKKQIANIKLKKGGK